MLSHRRLAKAAFSDDGSDLTAQSVLANITALESALAMATERPVIEGADLLEIHRLLFAGTRDEHHVGRLRDE